MFYSYIYVLQCRSVKYGEQGNDEYTLMENRDRLRLFDVQVCRVIRGEVIERSISA